MTTTTKTMTTTTKAMTTTTGVQKNPIYIYDNYSRQK